MRLITSLLILAIILSIYPAIGEANSLQARIIELQNEGYKNVEYISGDLFRFCCRDYYGGWLFGIVNSQGKEVVPAIYYEILIESENRIAVYGPQGWCYIDMQGNPINNDHYETVQACFSGGRAWVGKASEEGLLRYFCIDSEGNEISPFGWNYARPFQNGIAIVGTNQISLSNGSFFDDCYQLSYGFIDYMGNVVCEPKWDYLSDFSSTGIAICGKYNSNNEMRFGYINSNGIEMTAIEWKTADAFSESYAIVSTEQNVWKILDEHFNCVQSLDDISNMGAVHSGLIAASFIDRKNQSLNNVYININGEVVIRPDAEMICPFVDGFACICKKGYKYKSEIAGDNALFSETGLCGAINTEGVSVITPEWDMIANCGSGVFIVEKDAEYRIINAMLQKASSQSFKMIYSSIINGKLLGITADDRFVSIDPETFVLRDTIISDNERKVIGDNTIYSDY